MSDDLKASAGVDTVNLASVPVDQCSEDPTAVGILEGQDPQLIAENLYQDRYEHPEFLPTRAQVNYQTGEITLIRDLPDRPKYSDADSFIMKDDTHRRYVEVDGGWFPILTRDQVAALEREQTERQRQVEEGRKQQAAWKRELVNRGATLCLADESTVECSERAGNRPGADDFNYDDLPGWAQRVVDIGEPVAVVATATAVVLTAPVSSVVIGGGALMASACNNVVSLPDWYLHPDARDGNDSDIPESCKNPQTSVDLTQCQKDKAAMLKDTQGGEVGDAGEWPDSSPTPDDTGQDINFTLDLGMTEDVSQDEVTDDGFFPDVQQNHPCDPDGNGFIDDDQIPDAVLRQKIKDTLGVGPGNIISLSQAKALTSLIHYGFDPVPKITTLQGIQCFTNLTWIDFLLNQISDLSPLQGLVNLKVLRLIGNQIVDLTPLQGLVGLEVLYLEANQIVDLAPLQGLVNLEDLSLWSNMIYDLSSLQQLTNLTSLNLTNNKISDLAPLQGLVNLEVLGLGTNQISDLTPLQELVKLIELRLSYNQVSNVIPLQWLVNLKVLYLAANKIGNIGGLLLNPGLSTGDEVRLYDNPKLPTSQVDQLCLKGPTVYYPVWEIGDNKPYCN